MVSVFREIEEDISGNSVEQQHSMQKAPKQAVLWAGTRRSFLPARQLRAQGAGGWLSILGIVREGDSSDLLWH